MSVSTKVATRITSQLKRYQPILRDAQKRDANEPDTVGIITSILADVLGYDKFKEVSSQHAIRGTYADLVVTVDDKVRFLIEAKEINTELKESHVTQAINYAANDGIPWAVVTNGVVWRLYYLKFGKSLDRVLVFEIDVLACDCKSEDVLNCFGSLSSEGYSKDTLADLLNEKQTCSKFAISAFLRSNAMVDALRKEVRRLSGLKLEPGYLLSLLENDIIKRELVDSDDANNAVAYVKKLRKVFEKDREADDLPAAAAPAPAATVDGAPRAT